MEKKLFTITLLLFGFLLAHAQTIITFTASQSNELEAKSGNDAEITSGEFVMLGATPSATGGTAPYSYSWNDGNIEFSSESNPSVSPDETTTYTLLVTDNRTCTARDMLTINISLTGVNDFKEDELRIYPNPASDRVTIDYREANYTISLFNDNGKLMWTRTLNGKNTFSTPHTPGIYLLRTNSNEKESVRRIVITN